MHTFLNWRNILSWIPIGSDLDPNRVCKCRERKRERERERLVQARQSKHCIGGSTSRERERGEERDVCVCVCVCSFWISSVCFFTLGTHLRISKFFAIFAKKIWSYETSSSFDSWVQSLTQNYWVRVTILTGIRSRQREQKRFGFLKEERNCVVIHR